MSERNDRPGTSAGTGVDGLQGLDPQVLEPLLKHMQMGLRVGNVKRAEAVLERAEMDDRLEDLEKRLSFQQSSNEMLFRRVQMLEQALQIERARRFALQDQIAAVPGGSPSKSGPMCLAADSSSLKALPPLEASLLQRKVFTSCRAILQANARAEMDAHASLGGIFSPSYAGTGEPSDAADPLAHL
eukprot:gb/GFBE01062052.1/.p1 GENE.gb/GFBE01062052.1/~~gb/GFBE01062052.1/.p1  ORF type:complete len:186 (+),score=40.61 gb/GFBE01062052.1/:1-558(+)